MDMLKIFREINQLSKHSKDRSEDLGEVFTPFLLIEEMVDVIPKSHFLDPTKTFLDSCAGKGNMPAVLVERLMDGLKEHFPDEQERYKHIMENQIFMCEFQRESALDIEKVFNPERKLKLNLYVGDTLVMPEDFFDIPYERRLKKYPQHCIYGVVNGKMPEPGKPFVEPLF